MCIVRKKKSGAGIVNAKDLAKSRFAGLMEAFLMITKVEKLSDGQYFGCELYNSVTADNGVTRYSLCYEPGNTK